MLILFENKMLKKKFGDVSDEGPESGQTYTRRSIIISNPHQIFVRSNKNGIGQVCMGGERCIQGFGGKTLTERNHL